MGVILTRSRAVMTDLGVKFSTLRITQLARKTLYILSALVGPELVC